MGMHAKLKFYNYHLQVDIKTKNNNFKIKKHCNFHNDTENFFFQKLIISQFSFGYFGDCFHFQY